MKLEIITVENNSTDVLVPRDGAIIYESGLTYNLKGTAYSKCIIKSPEADSYFGPIVGKFDPDSGQKHPPICVFDGEKILSLSEIKKAQPWVTDAIQEENSEDEKELKTSIEFK